MRRLAILFIFFITAAVCTAQLRWKKADSLYAPLPASVHVWSCADTLNGFPFVAYYTSVRLKDKALQFSAQTGQGKRFTPLQYYQLEQFPILVVNCAYFSFTTNQNFNVVIRDGKMLSYNITSLRGTGPDSLLYYYPTRSAIGIDRQRRADVAWLFTDSTRRWPYAFEDRPVVAKGVDSTPTIYSLNDIEWKWWKMRTAVGGGPVLIHDGKILITDRQEQLYPGDDREGEHLPRTAMGYTRDGKLIVLAIQGRAPGMAAGVTLQEEAQIMLSLGCYEALNLDGGGSSCLLINGKETIRPSDKMGQRPVPAVFLVNWNK
ncbi:MAG TPA: phosphodiester glycosidase family protein [Puia sp.]|nr:phosphodiester glycosidase family protein [Puia sp.]